MKEKSYSIILLIIGIILIVIRYLESKNIFNNLPITAIEDVLVMLLIILSVASLIGKKQH